MFLRCLKAELVKFHRSPVWLAFVLLPVFPAILGTVNYLGNIEVLENAWYSLWSQHTLFSSMFFLPALLSVFCAWQWRLEHTDHNWNSFLTAPVPMAELPEEQQPEHMGIESSDCVHWMVDYICQHRQAVKLLLCRAEGTGYEQFIHNMVEVEVESTLRYMEVLRHLGRDVPELSRSLCHIIASGMFSGLFEIVVHDMPREQAQRDVEQFRQFYTGGWLKLMGG